MEQKIPYTPCASNKKVIIVDQTQLTFTRIEKIKISPIGYLDCLIYSQVV